MNVLTEEEYLNKIRWEAFEAGFYKAIEEVECERFQGMTQSAEEAYMDWKSGKWSHD